MYERHIFALGLTTALLSVAAPAVAQTAPADDASASASGEADQGPIAEIIVTAERRENSIQTTPLTISAVDGNSLARSQITNVEALAGSLPTVTFGRSNADARVFIRGVGLNSISDGADPRVALYTDGVYHPRSQGALSAFYDLERVEVLSGPQGTLYGRNATAGAVNIISRDPGDTLNGYAALTVGNYGTIRTEGAIGGPVSGILSARIAFQTADRDGFGTNISTGGHVDDEKTRAVRAKLKLDDDSGFSITVQGDYFEEDDHAGGYRYLGDTPGNRLFSAVRGFAVPGPRDSAAQGPDFHVKAYGVGMTAVAELGDVTMTSVSGYRHFENDILGNVDGTAAGYLPRYTREKSDSISQELRADFSLGPVDFLIGAYYFAEDNKVASHAPLSGAYFNLPTDALRRGVVRTSDQETEAFALFTQNTVNLTDRLGIDLGLRYSYERRNVLQTSEFNLAVLFDPAAPIGVPLATTPRVRDRRNWSSVDPKITLHYQLAPRIFTYATYSRGFKSGGFNLGGIQPPFDPEDITNYEVGIKADLFDRRVRANVSTFYYDYTNLQVNSVEGVTLITKNAAQSRIYGVEGQFTFVPVDNLKIDFNPAYLDAKYEDYVTADPARPGAGPLPGGAFDLSGNRLTYAPKWKLNGEIAYTIETSAGEFTPRASATYQSRIDFSEFNLDYTSQKGFTLVDLYLDWKSPDGAWSGGVFVRNLTNEFYALSKVVGSNFLGFPIQGLLGAPRTYGVSLRRNF